MAVLKLYPHDKIKLRHVNLSRKRNSKERCGCFNVAAQNNLSLLNQSYSPNVNYSLKKRQRWKLLEEVNRNPTAIFDEDSCPENVQIVVSSRQRCDADCSVPNSCSQFYHRNSSGVTEVKDSTRQRHKNINTRSMIGMTNRKQGISNENKVEITFLSTHTAMDQWMLEAEATWSKPEVKCAKRKRKSRLNNYTRYLAREEEQDFYDELYDDSYSDFYDDEEVDEEENAIPDASEYQVSLPDISQSTTSHDFEIISETEDLSDFEVLEEKSVVLAFHDKVKVYRRLIYLPEVEVSVDQLKTAYGNAFVFGSADSDICAINISDVLGKRILRPKASELRNVQAYVIIEKVAEHLSVCLNCYVDPDLVSEIYPPSLKGKTTIEEIVEECVLQCLLEYQSALVIEDRQFVTEVSGFGIPLDEKLQMKKTMIDSVLPSTDSDLTCKAQSNDDSSQCGICFSDFQCGGWSVLKGCSHAFCEACWSQHLLSQVNTGHHVLSCPAVGCQQAVDFVTKLRHLSVNILHSHHRQVTSAVMESHKDFVWCPNSTCSRPMRLLGLSEHRQSSLSLPANIWCSCNAFFCPDCRQEAHWPASCDVYRSYVTDLQKRGDWMSAWKLSDLIPIRIFTKPCPSCCTGWEKAGGCNSMDCGVCSTTFCWYCGLRESEHKKLFPCNEERYAEHKPMKANVTDILPEVTSIHLRLIAEEFSISNLKSRFSRLVKRAISNADTEINHCDLETKTISFFRGLRGCAQISQFSKVAAKAEVNAEHQQIFDACSKTFEDLTINGLRALKDLSAVELPKTFKQVVTRLGDCQTEGRTAAQRLATCLASERQGR